MFLSVLLACLLPVALGVAIVMYDEGIAHEGGVYKHH